MRAFIISILFLALLSCSKDQTQNEIIELTGIIKEQGVTSYQYGTHTLTTNSTFYALTSDDVDLDQFVDEEVLIEGFRIVGYPIEGGPEYIAVIRINPL